MIADTLCRKRKRLHLNKSLCRMSERFEKMTYIWPLKRSNPQRKDLNPPHSLLKTVRAISLETK
jgi:hypothetical protein